jgi:hypothetical protein
LRLSFALFVFTKSYKYHAKDENSNPSNRAVFAATFEQLGKIRKGVYREKKMDYRARDSTITTGGANAAALEIGGDAIAIGAIE